MNILLYKNNKNVNFVRFALTAVFMTGVVGVVWAGNMIEPSLGPQFQGLKQEWGTPGKTDIVVVEDGARPEMYDGLKSRSLCGRTTHLQSVRRSIVVPNRMGKYERNEVLPTYTIGDEAFQERVLLAPDFLEGYVLLLFQPYEFVDNPVQGGVKVVKFPDENSNGILNTTKNVSDRIDFWICGGSDISGYTNFINGDRRVGLGYGVIADNRAGSFKGVGSSDYRKLWTDYLNTVNFKYEKFVFVQMISSDPNGSNPNDVWPGVVVRYGSSGNKKMMYAMYGVWKDDKMAKKYGFSINQKVYFSDNRELLPSPMDPAYQMMTVQGLNAGIERVYRYGGKVFTEAEAELNRDKLAWRSKPYHSEMDYSARVDGFFGDFRDTLNFLSDNMYGVLGRSWNGIIMEYRRRLNGRDELSKADADRFKAQYFSCDSCGGIDDLTGLDAIPYIKPANPDGGGSQGMNVGIMAGYPDPIFYWALFSEGLLRGLEEDPEQFSNLSDFLSIEHFINNSLTDYYDPTVYGVDNKQGESLSPEQRDERRYMQGRGAVNTDTPPWGSKIFDRETGKLLSQKFQALDPTMGTNWNLIGLHREEQQTELDEYGNPLNAMVVFDTLFQILENGKTGFKLGQFDYASGGAYSPTFGRMVEESDLRPLYKGEKVHKCDLCKKPLRYGGHGYYYDKASWLNWFSLNERGVYLHGLMQVGDNCGFLGLGNIQFMNYLVDDTYIYINDVLKGKPFEEEVIVNYVPVYAKCDDLDVIGLGEGGDNYEGNYVKAKILSIDTIFMYEKTEEYTFGILPGFFWGNFNKRWPYDPRRKDSEGHSYTKGYRGGKMSHDAKNKLPHVTCNNKNADKPVFYQETEIRTGYGDITGRIDSLRADIIWDFEHFFKDFRASDTIDGQYWKDKFPTATSIAEANVMKLFEKGYYFERALSNNVAWDYYSDSGWYVGNPQNGWLPYYNGMDMFIHNEDYQSDQEFIPVFQQPAGDNNLFDGMFSGVNLGIISDFLGMFGYKEADFYNGAVFKTMLKWPIVYYDANNSCWLLGYIYTRPRTLAHFVITDNYEQNYDYSQDPIDEEGEHRQFWYYNARFVGEQDLTAWTGDKYEIQGTLDGRFTYLKDDARPMGNIWMNVKANRRGFLAAALNNLVIGAVTLNPLNKASEALRFTMSSFAYPDGDYPLHFVSPIRIGGKYSNEYLTLLKTVFPSDDDECRITRTMYQRADEVYAQKDLATDLEDLDERPDGWPNDIEKQAIWEIAQLVLWGEGVNMAMKGLYWLFTECTHPAVSWTAGAAYAAGQRVESNQAVKYGINMVKEGWRLYKEIQMSLDLINDIIEKWEELGYAWEGLRTTALYLYEYYENFEYNKEQWWRVTQLFPIGAFYSFDNQLSNFQNMKDAFVKTFDNMGIFLDSSHAQYYIQQGTIKAWDFMTRKQVEELMVEIPLNGVKELSFASKFAETARQSGRQSGGEKFWSIGTGMAVENLKQYRLHALTNGMLAINMVLSTTEREAKDWIEFHGYINRVFNPAALDTLEWITMGRSYHSDWVSGMTYDGDSIGQAIDTFKWRPSMSNIRKHFRTPSGLFEQDLYARLSPIGDYDYWAAPSMWDFVTVDKNIQAKKKARRDKKNLEARLLQEQSYQKYVLQKESERELTVKEYVDSMYRVVPHTISPDPSYTNEEWEIILQKEREREIQKFKERYDDSIRIVMKSDRQQYVDYVYSHWDNNPLDSTQKSQLNPSTPNWDSLVKVPFTGHPEGGYTMPTNWDSLVNARFPGREEGYTTWDSLVGVLSAERSGGGH